MKLSKTMSHAESDAVSELSDQSLLAVFGGAAPSASPPPPPTSGGPVSARGDNSPTANATNGASASSDPTHRTQTNTNDKGESDQYNDFFGNDEPVNNGNTNNDSPVNDKGNTLSDRAHDTTPPKNHDSYGHNHQTPMEALDHGIHQIADGIADLAVAFIGSLPHHDHHNHQGFHGVGLDFGRKGRGGRG